MALNFHPPGPSHPFEGRGGENFILIGEFVELEAARKVPNWSFRKFGTFLQAESEPGLPALRVFEGLKE